LDEANPFRAEHEPSIVAAVGVAEYRETIPHVVRSTDFVLEIGSHHGTTTRLLDAAGAAAVGVDVGAGVVTTARKQAPELRFEIANAWSPAGLLRMLGGQKVDVIYVDVGGLSGQDGLLESLALLRSLGSTLEVS
jgi:protein-L-isoaspartate O-methyltransferase